MKRLLLTALAAAALLPLSASAHKAWLLPSSTTVAAGQWITVDAAVSNDIFYFNHAPMRLDNLQLTAPDGSALQPQNPNTGRYRSTFDVELKTPGTYRLAIVNQGLFASWKENGEQKRWRGTVEKFKTEVPANAEELQVMEANGRIEAFVTAGNPTPVALTNKGIELKGDTHPNDLFAGESATFTLLLDGKPLPNQEVEIIPAGIRYRDAQNEITTKTGADGTFSVEWPGPGLYWMETSMQDDTNVTPPAKQRRTSYAATFEVLAQ